MPLQLSDLHVVGRSAFGRDFERQRLVEVQRTDSAEPVVVERPIGRRRLVTDGVSPGRDRVVLQGERKEGVYAWPSLEPIFERRCGAHFPVVDWHSGHLVAFELRNGRLEAYPLDGGPPLGLDVTSSGKSLVALGHGVVAITSPGLTLFGLRNAWRLPLLEGRRRGFQRPSLSSDRRGVRLVIGEKPVRFDVEIETGKLLAGPDIESRTLTDIVSEDGNSKWHPHADLIFQRRRGFFELRTLSGDVLGRLPGNGYPKSWMGDGSSILVGRGAMIGEWLELWRGGVASP